MKCGHDLPICSWVRMLSKDKKKCFFSKCHDVTVKLTFDFSDIKCIYLCIYHVKNLCGILSELQWSHQFILESRKTFAPDVMQCHVYGNCLRPWSSTKFLAVHPWVKGIFWFEVTPLRHCCDIPFLGMGRAERWTNIHISAKDIKMI